MPLPFLFWIILSLPLLGQLSATRLAAPIQVLVTRVGVLAVMAAPFLLGPHLAHDVVNMSPMLANASRFAGSDAGRSFWPASPATI